MLKNSTKVFVLKDENAVFYECGYSCDNEIYLSLGDKTFFITDGRYDIDARTHIKKAQVVIARDLVAKTLEILNENGINELIFNPDEWSVSDFEKLNSQNHNLIPEANFSQKKRIIKTKEEILLLSKAAKIGAECFDAFCEYLHAEGREKSEKRLFFEAKKIFGDYDSRSLSFDPIVAIGSSSALPHAHPTNKILANDEVVLFDAGVKYARYCSDRTRTITFIPNIKFDYNQNSNYKKFHEVYHLVLKAHDAAIAFIKPGVKANEIDAIGRDIITAGGYGDKFVHSTGHGVGLDIHELPVISAKSETVIEEGMVFTIEPGIYLEGEFGVRIEDTVVVTSEGAKIL